MKNKQFEEITYEQWQETATASLKNLPFEKLITKTLEGIDLLPLYTKEQYKENEEVLQTVREGVESPQWKIGQLNYAAQSDEFLKQTKEALEKGNEAIVYDGRWPVTWEKEDIEELAGLMKEVPIYLFNIEEDDKILDVFSSIKEEEKKKIHGVYLGGKELPNGFVNVRQAGVDTVDLHLKGADIITELAVALSHAVTHLNNYESFKDGTEQLFVRFSIDTHFFMEIAKLRAFRVLWKAVSSAYGEEPKRIPIFSETALRTFSNLDPYVNLLRAGNEAFSAAIGGTDVLTVHPYNVTSRADEKAIRYARNTQLVIREETQVKYVLDPAGGSYFIEQLTEEMVEKAWKLFLEIEESGGYESYITSTALEEKLNDLTEKRIEKLAKREHTLVGTNSFADVAAEVNIEGKEDSLRLAKVYEDYWSIFSESQPKTVLLGFGKLKDYKRISDFTKNYLASAGIKAEESPEFQSVDDYKEWRETNDFDYGVICTTKDHVNEVVQDIVNLESSQKMIDVAGNYKEEFEKDWKEQGIEGLIYNGQNQLDKFSAIQKRWEEVKDIETT